MKDLEYNKYGTFSVEDFIALAKGSREHFRMFQIYKSENKGTPSIFSMEGLLTYIPPDYIVPLFKIYTMVSRYKFLKTIAKTSAAIAL